MSIQRNFIPFREKEAALRRKEELKKTQLETLARHERELHERKRMERDFEEKKRREMESLIASTDVNRYFWASTVDARRKKQVNGIFDLHMKTNVENMLIKCEKNDFIRNSLL